MCRLIRSDFVSSLSEIFPVEEVFPTNPDQRWELKLFYSKYWYFNQCCGSSIWIRILKFAPIWIRIQTFSHTVVTLSSFKNIFYRSNGTWRKLRIELLSVSPTFFFFINYVYPDSYSEYRSWRIQFGSESRTLFSTL